MTWISAVPGGVRIQVHVQPRASRTGVAGLHGDALKVRLAAPPVDGAANEALLRFVADTLALPRGAVTLVSGASSRRKVVAVHGITVEHTREQLEPEHR